MAVFTNCAAYGLAAKTQGFSHVGAVKSVAYSGSLYTEGYQGAIGLGAINGTVRRQQADGSLPAVPHARVFLHARASGTFVKQTVSDAGGVYAFTGLSDSMEFYVVAFDPDLNYNAVIADRVTPL